MQSNKSRIFEYQTNLKNANGNSIESTQQEAEFFYLKGLNYISNQYIKKHNKLQKVIYLIKRKRLKFILILVGLLGASVGLSFLGIIGLIIGPILGVASFVYLFRKIKFLNEELNDTKELLEEEELDFKITGIKQLYLPLYINKISEGHFIISDAAKIFSKVNFLFSIMKDPELVQDGFDKFKERYQYLNKFMLMPNKRDYKEILKNQENKDAIRSKLIEKILNPSFERIKSAFEPHNIEETRLKLNAVIQDSGLEDDVLNIMKDSKLREEVPDLLSYLNKQKDKNFLIYQSINELKEILVDLQKWIHTIVRSDLPQYLKNQNKLLNERIGQFQKKLSVTADMLEKTFHKDIELFKAFNNYHFCENCGSTNYDEILRKIDIERYTKRTLLNNATKDEILQLEYAPDVGKNIVKKNKTQIRTKLQKLPIFENIDKHWGIDPKSFPILAADFKLTNLNRVGDKYEYICPECNKNETVEINRAIEPLAFSYLAGLKNLRERMEKDKDTFIRNIHDLKISKEEKMVDIGSYELAYMEAVEKMNDLRMQTEVAETILEELSNADGGF